MTRQRVMGQFARYLNCLYANGRRKWSREELTEELMRNRQELIEDYEKIGIVENLSYILHQ